MTFFYAVVLECNRCLKRITVREQSLVMPARSQAARHGWRFRKREDLCPEHAGVEDSQ